MSNVSGNSKCLFSLQTVNHTHLVSKLLFFWPTLKTAISLSTCPTSFATVARLLHIHIAIFKYSTSLPTLHCSEDVLLYLLTPALSSILYRIKRRKYSNWSFNCLTAVMRLERVRKDSAKKCNLLFHPVRLAFVACQFESKI